MRALNRPAPHAAPRASERPLPLQTDAVERAMRREQVARARGFSAIATLLSMLVAVQLPWLGGDPTRRAAAAVALTLMIAIAAFTFFRTSAPERFTPAIYRTFGWGLSTGILAVELYAGFFSPITVVLSVGIYFLGQSTDRLHARLLSLYVTLGWLTGATLEMTGVIEDRGLYSSAHLAATSHALMITGVGACMLTTAWLAQLTRRSVYNAIVEAHRAAADARKRDALLLEAEQQLDHAMRLMADKAGEHSGQLAGHYRLGDVLGVGAMGEVYSARHIDGSHYAAVKLLHNEAMRREENVVRFLREATLCMRFDHPHVIKVYDVGRMDDGAPFMAMARLDGMTLSALLRARGQLELDEVLQLADAIAAGLAHAHGCGVVHRDLKPHNILQARVNGETHWTIVDFGISKPIDSEGTLTGDGGVLGTPAYMSPEQARGRVVDHRSDVFSFCSVIYRALTGRPAFPGKDTPGIMFDVAYRMPDRPSLQVEGISADMDLALAIGFAKDPEQRFDSPEALCAALHAAARGELDELRRAHGRALLALHPWSTGGHG